MSEALSSGTKVKVAPKTLVNTVSNSEILFKNENQCKKIMMNDINILSKYSMNIIDFSFASVSNTSQHSTSTRILVNARKGKARQKGF